MIPLQSKQMESVNGVHITGKLVTSSIITFMASNLFISVLASSSL